MYEVFKFTNHILEQGKKINDEEEDDVPEKVGEDMDTEQSKEKTDEADDHKIDKKFFYKRLGRYYLFDNFKGEKGLNTYHIALTSAAYNPSTKILVTGFNHGAFLIHEMPEVNLIHSLKISDQEISSVSLNATGDWIALGCAGIGQLLVWEWQSETYVMKQQGHFDAMTSVTYSPDGSYLATGGHDSKVKGIAL